MDKLGFAAAAIWHPGGRDGGVLSLFFLVDETGILVEGGNLEWRGGLSYPSCVCTIGTYSVVSQECLLLFSCCDQDPDHYIQSSQNLPMHNIETMSSNCTSINATLMVHKKVSKQRIQKGQSMKTKLR